MIRVTARATVRSTDSRTQKEGDKMDDTTMRSAPRMQEVQPEAQVAVESTVAVLAAFGAGLLGSRPPYVTESGVEAFACCHAVTAHG